MLWHADAVGLFLVLALPFVLFMLVLVVAPVIAGVSLFSRLTSKRAAPAEPGPAESGSAEPTPAQPTPAERLLRRPLSTGALVAWLVIPLLVIGLWATLDALTEGSDPPAQPALRAGGVPGLWKTSRGAMVIFAADGTFTETNLPNPPPDEPGYPAGFTIPRSATGKWQLDELTLGSQYVSMSLPGTFLDLAVRWQPVTGGQGYFVLQLYESSSSAYIDPAYQLIRQGGT